MSGQNDRGQLGLGQKISSADHFQLIENLPQKMSAIAAGEGHTIVVDCHGEIYAFGDNKYEKITSDTNLNLFEPFYVDQFRSFEVLQVVCGGQQTVILAKTKSIQGNSIKTLFIRKIISRFQMTLMKVLLEQIQLVRRKLKNIFLNASITMIAYQQTKNMH